MSNNIIFTNNASALLAVTINATATSIQVAAGYGANFPSPTGDQYFYLTLEDDDGTIEVVKITGVSGDILSCDSSADRGKDGTSPATHTLNTTRCELRLVKSVMEEFLQKNGGTMTGALNMNAQNLVDALINGSSTVFSAGKIVGVSLQGHLTIVDNILTVPTDGIGRATVGGAEILAVGDDIVAQLATTNVIILDSGTVGTRIPAGAYLRVEGTTDAIYLEMSHDDTDFAFVYATTGIVASTGATEYSFDGEVSVAGGLTLTSIGITAEDLDVSGVNMIDFSLTKQAVTGEAVTEIDYSLGSYVTLTMTANISAFTIINPPATNVATLRIKVIQGAGPFAINDWPGVTKFSAGGVEIVLSQGSGEIDFIDLWTDDGGTTWYAGFDNDWAVPA